MTYQKGLFNMVESKFNHFYVSSDRLVDATIESVDVIINPAVEERFVKLEAKYSEVIISKIERFLISYPSNIQVSQS